MIHCEVDKFVKNELTSCATKIMFITRGETRGTENSHREIVVYY
jgi:hypothetical protein